MQIVTQAAVVDQFRVALERAGIEPPARILDDGTLHRFSTNGKAGDDSGWYVLHGDGIPAGAFGDWRSGTTHTFRADVGRELTREELEAHRQRLERINAERDAEREREHAVKAARAAEIWDSAELAPEAHPYLTRKGVQAHGLRVHHGALVVPMMAEGKLCSLQFIATDGDKRFLTGGRTRGCYHAIGARTPTLCIAEGYATGASIHEATGHAVAVAFSASNLRPVAEALRAKHPEVQIIICGDNDASGTGQRAALEAAQAVGGAVAIPKGEGMDWNDVHRAEGLEAVRAGVEAADGRLGFKCQHNGCADRHWADLRELVDGPRERRQGANDEKSSKSSGCSRGASENSKFAPEPLRRPMPPAAPYPTDALPEILAAAVAAAHEVIQAPAAICGQSFLAAASLAAQAHADVEIDGRIELLSLFALTIGESGERKSAVDAVALLAHREFERRRMREFGPEFAEFENARAAYETARNSILKKKAKESPSDAQERIGYELKKLGPPPEEPAKPILFTATPTLEGLHKLFVSGLPSVGLFHDDAGEFIGGHAMSDENRLKSAAGLSKLWDRGEFDRVRAGDGANKYFGRRVASHLMVQPVVAERVLSDDILTQQGLLARTLLAWPTSTIGDRLYVARDLTQHHAIQNFSRRIGELLARPWRFAEDSQHELEPPVLHLTHDAKELWVAAHDAIEADQKEGGAWVNVRPWASKGGAQILRIAGVFTVIEDPDAAMIERDAIARAARLVDWHLAEAVRIVGTAMVPTEVRNAEAVLEWCRRERRDAIHSRQAMQFGPSAIRSLDTFNAAMAVLERTGWAAPIEGGAVIDGKQRRRVWGVRWELTA